MATPFILASVLRQERMWCKAFLRMLPAESTTPDGVRKKRTNLQGWCLRIVSAESPVKLYCCYAVIAVLSAVVIALSVAMSLSDPGKAKEDPNKNMYAFCPRYWIGVGSKCFNFSETPANWTSCQTFCMAQGAQLARFDTEEELDFLKRHSGDSDYWIGLHRESSAHPWMWTDHTEYNNLTSIRGEGESAYVINKNISSGKNYTHRNCICSKAYSYASESPACSQLVSKQSREACNMLCAVTASFLKFFY